MDGPSNMPPTDDADINLYGKAALVAFLSPPKAFGCGRPGAVEFELTLTMH
jgi:hypothetical protein